ncbi:hypothetical protein [Thalassolituus sp. C2-1]|uniref:hypothetical protein n=1 Tax=Venatorbacter sp. C2-1 TaxID=2597518 RepID=UPI00119214C8|nr:hypothetical protein [Thalassolituus sp. C2-1]TVV41815.1 hypothetical protein FOT50_17630 [Thalassolituus sp. C2-1]
MFEYEKIEPVFPGNHIDDWQKIRKKQWKYVKRSLGIGLGILPDAIASIKKNVYLLESPIFDTAGSESSAFPTPKDHPGHWGPAPLAGFFLCADQSEEAWDEIWKLYSETTNGETFDGFRQRFLQYVPYGQGPDENNQDLFGTFGGLEQRMLPYLIQSDVYTDDVFQIGRFEYRKVPWKSAHYTFAHIFSHISRAVDKDYFISPFTYAQWLHGLYVSCFSFDLEQDAEFDEESLYLYCQRLVNVLDSNADETFHPNHLKAARLLLTILEDEGTPNWLRKIWVDVRDGKVSV